MRDFPTVDAVADVATRPVEWLINSSLGPWKTAAVVLPVLTVQLLWLDVMCFLLLAAFITDVVKDAHRRQKASA